MNTTIRIKLSTMMFLEFFIWGAWFVTMGTFLGKNLLSNDVQIGSAYSTQSLGAIIAPFIIGLIADKFFSAQKVLGFLHLTGGILLWIAGTSLSFELFFPFILGYMIAFMPTLALVNSISFKQLKDPGKEFPSIRVFGTVGWILAGLIIGWLNWEQSGNLVLTFKMASVASIILGVFSFFLPKTPPVKKGEKTSIGEILGLDALRLLKNRSYLLFFIASVAICIPLAFYYNFTNPFLNEVGIKKAAGIQSMGQVSETLFMLLMPLFFARLGVKKMLAIGMSAWVIRYLFFAYGNSDSNYWMLIGGIVLHGICYDFFFVTGQIYTDRLAGDKFKSSAQGFITLATYGVGMLIGSIISGMVVNNYVQNTTHDWYSIWIIPAGISGLVALLFILFFKDKNSLKSKTEVSH